MKLHTETFYFTISSENVSTLKCNLIQNCYCHEKAQYREDFRTGHFFGKNNALKTSKKSTYELAQKLLFKISKGDLKKSNYIFDSRACHVFE